MMDETLRFEIVNSIKEYLELVLDNHTTFREQGESLLQYFRGQSNCNWPALPGLFREENGVDKEHEIIREAMQKSPIDFVNHLTHFDRLTKLQHYGLRTRLLDVSLNPLVALYFACDSCSRNGLLIPDSDNLFVEIQEDDGNQACFDMMWNGDATVKYQMKPFSTKYPPNAVYGSISYDGAVFVGEDYPKRPEDEMPDMVARISALRLEGDKISELLTLFGMSSYFNPKIDMVLDALQNDYLILPDYSNERIKRQHGAFLLPSSIQIDVRNDSKLDNRITKTARHLNNKFHTKIIIPHSVKESILEELDFLNINESTLFPELDHQLNYVISKLS